jgi:hypothetical protein
MSNPMSAVHVARAMNGAVALVTGLDANAGPFGLSAARALGVVGWVTSLQAVATANRTGRAERLRIG